MAHSWELPNPWLGIPHVGDLIAALQADLQTLYGFNYSGHGSPNNVVTAVPGSTYHNLDGGANTSFYVKESGSGNTGWVAK